MIIYNPLDGDAFTTSIPSNPRHCFLMTRLGKSIPAGVDRIRIKEAFDLIDASSRVTAEIFEDLAVDCVLSTPLGFA